MDLEVDVFLLFEYPIFNKFEHGTYLLMMAVFTLVFFDSLIFVEVNLLWSIYEVALFCSFLKKVTLLKIFWKRLVHFCKVTSISSFGMISRELKSPLVLRMSTLIACNFVVQYTSLFFWVLDFFMVEFSLHLQSVVETQCIGFIKQAPIGTNVHKSSPTLMHLLHELGCCPRYAW